MEMMGRERKTSIFSFLARTFGCADLFRGFSRAFLLFIATSIIVSSCATVPGNDSPQTPQQAYPTLKVSELRAEAVRNPSAVLEYISRISGDESASLSGNSAIPDLVSYSLQTIYDRYEAAIATKTWDEALTWFRDLVAVFETDTMRPFFPAGVLAALANPDALDERKLLAALAESFRERTFHTASRLVFLRSLKAGPNPFRTVTSLGSTRADPEPTSRESMEYSKELSLWFERAIESGDTAAAAEILSVADAAGTGTSSMPKKAKPVPGVLDSLAPTPTVDGATSDSVSESLSAKTLSSMISGVVTVRIDRGLKIENGVGIPDRVIGSGFYIEKSGYILTNYHVIESEVDPSFEGYSRLTIRPAGSPDLRIPAKVIGWDRLLDLALLKTELKPSYVFTLSGNPKLAPGEKILAIGSPAGLESTVTSGIVSAGGRKISQIGEAVQVDAALNPGNSGGPMLDSTGQVAGVVFAGLPQFQGLNFCIPSVWVRAVLPELFAGGEVTHSWLGVALVQEPEGVEIAYCHPSIPDGLSEGDLLMRLASKPITDIASAQLMLLAPGFKPNTLIPVTLSGKKPRTGSIPGTSSPAASPPTVEYIAPSKTILRNLQIRPLFPMESAAETQSHSSLMVPLYGMSVKRMPPVFLDPDRYTIVRIWNGGIADEAGLSVNDPFSVNSFSLDEKGRSVDLVIRIKKRQAGFMESLVSLPASLEIPDIL